MAERWKCWTTLSVTACLATIASFHLLDHTVTFFQPAHTGARLGLRTGSPGPAGGIASPPRPRWLAGLRTTRAGDGAEATIPQPPRPRPGLGVAPGLPRVGPALALAAFAAVVAMVRSPAVQGVLSPLAAEHREPLHVFRGRPRPVEIAAPTAPASPVASIFESINPANPTQPAGRRSGQPIVAEGAGPVATPSAEGMEPTAASPERFFICASSLPLDPTMGVSVGRVGGAGLGGLLVAGSVRLALTRLPVVLGLADLLDRWDDADNSNRSKHAQGCFAPVEREHFGLPMAVAEGAIPEGLEGLYVRVGPNPTKHMLSRGYHLFDGHGMIHSVRIANRSAAYSNQYVRTPRLELEDRYQRPVVPQVGELRGLTGLLRAAVLWPLISRSSGLPPEEQGTANTNVYLHDHRLYVGHESSYPFEIQWREDNFFDTLGYNTMRGQLDYPVTAHPKVDPEDGRLYFNGYHAMHEVDMKFGVFSEGKLHTYLPFRLAQKNFMHDMLITQHYVVFFESSVAVDTIGIVKGKLMSYNERHRMRVGLFPKLATDSAAVRWFEAPGSLGTLHAMNAWEAGPDEVAVFAIGVPAFDSDFKEAFPTQLHHFRLNLQTGTMTVEVVGPDHMVEFPRVHPKFLGRPSQFGYAGKFAADADWLVGVVKFDLFRGKFVSAITMPEGTLCGEPVPIPKPGPAGQRSDGVYLGFFVHRKGQSGGEWRLYDGETMSPQPVVCLTVDEYVPIGFHGEWIAQPDLLAHLARGRAA